MSSFAETADQVRLILEVEAAEHLRRELQPGSAVAQEGPAQLGRGFVRIGSMLTGVHACVGARRRDTPSFCRLLQALVLWHVVGGVPAHGGCGVCHGAGLATSRRPCLVLPFFSPTCGACWPLLPPSLSGHECVV